MSERIDFPGFTAHLHQADLPTGLDLGPVVAVDSETMGLDLRRDRLCLVQLCGRPNEVHLVQIPRTGSGRDAAPNLVALLERPDVTKLFHFARFDVAAFSRHLGARTAPVWCTKIASRLVRTFTDRHGLASLCTDLLGVELSKQKQTSDWGAATLSREQLHYAASDVLYLHRLKAELEPMLVREGRLRLAEECFRFLPARAELDLLGYEMPDVFTH